MSKVKRPRIKAPERESEPEAAPAAVRARPTGFEPGSPLRDKVVTYSFGTMVCGAAMVAAAAWMGGSLGGIQQGMGAGADNIMRSVGLSIDKVVVLGLEPAVELRVREAAGVAEGDNMFAADPEAIRRRLGRLDAVTGVSVYRFWPDQITIVAEARQPMALWRSDDDWKVIDHNGRTFAEANPTDFMHLPRVQGVGADVSAAAFLAELEDYPVLEERVEVATRVGERRWDVEFAGGVVATLPEDLRLNDALADLNMLAVRSQVLDMPVAHIDVRHPDRFAIRPVPGAPEEPIAGGA
jgi:cell division protein FtsQ